MFAKKLHQLSKNVAVEIHPILPEENAVKITGEKCWSPSMISNDDSGWELGPCHIVFPLLAPHVVAGFCVLRYFGNKNTLSEEV